MKADTVAIKCSGLIDVSPSSSESDDDCVLWSYSSSTVLGAGEACKSNLLVLMTLLMCVSK